MRSLFACVVAVAVSAGCSHSGGPAWPKQHATDKDGGESLAPHEARAIAAVEASPDDKAAATSAADDSKPAKPAPAAVRAPAATPGTPQPTDETPVQTEEVIIEIDGSE